MTDFLQAEASPSNSKALLRRRILLAVLFAGAAALRFYLYYSAHYTTDDALITFRYAENLVEGNGFVYNIGQRVLGTTTPLFTLLLSGLLSIGIPCLAGAFLLSTFADFASACVLLNVFRGENPAIRWIPAFTFLYSPETLQWSLSGMETQVSIAFAFGAFYFASRESWKAAFAVAAASVVLRIDGLAVPGALTVCYLLRYGRLPASALITFCALSAPWFVFAWLYFGFPLPNSAAAKFALSGGGGFLAPVTHILVRGFLHLHSYGGLVFILSLLGTYDIYKNRKEWLPVAVWTWGYALSYTIAAGPMHPWYYAPFYAGWLFLAFAGASALIRRFMFLQNRVSQAAGVLGIIAIVLYLSYVRISSISQMQGHMEAMNKRVGLWLSVNSGSYDVVAVKDIGYIGYYSRRTILDLAGLVSPECIPFRIKNDFLGPIRKYNPEYFAFSEGQLKNLPLDQSGLLNQYKVAAKITNEWGSYVIFQRVK